MRGLSPRLQAIVDTLPLRPGLRVLEIGCGPGAAARAVAERIGPDGFILAVDRSRTAIRQAQSASTDLMDQGRLAFRQTDAETLALSDGEALFDLAFAIRVGALDGRHPEAGERARAAIATALKPGGKLFIDGGEPLREVAL